MDYQEPTYSDEGKRSICPGWPCCRGKLPAANRRSVNSVAAASHVSGTQFIGADADAAF